MRRRGKRPKRSRKENDLSGKNNEFEKEKRVVPGGTGGEAEHLQTIRVKMGERSFP